MDPELFSRLAVSDLPCAVMWGDRLFGEVEAFVPNDAEHVWTLGPRVHIYVELLPEHAGHSSATLFVDGFEEFLAAAARRGLEPASRETYENRVAKAIFRDPDGNEVGIGGIPA